MLRLTLLLALVLAAPAAAQGPTGPTGPIGPVVTPTATPTPAPTVQPGVTVAGVHVGGQTEEELHATLKTAVDPKVRVPFVVHAGGRKAELPTNHVGMRFDIKATIRRAFRAAADGAVTPRVRFHRRPLHRFVDAFAASVYAAPRDATISIHLSYIGRRRAHPGKRLPDKLVYKQIERAFKDPAQRRSLHARLKRVKAAVVSSDLGRRYPTIITVDKSTFTLRLFKHLRYDRSYSVAVGQPAYPTPEGQFAIQTKQVNPTWTAPNSPWAGESAGQSYDSSDPGNPLKARWMGVDGSVGIHGTGEDYSIGTAASHGCIRMHVSDVIDLFDRVSIGTPVLIGSS